MRVLREVAVRGSFSAAAEALSFTQSAVSQQIAALEREAGTILVQRNARGIRLTEAGEALGRHPETAYVAATTGVSNLYASIVSPSNEALYRYLTTDVAALSGVQHLETSPVIRTVKMTGRVGRTAAG